MCTPDFFSQTSFSMDMYLPDASNMENVPLSNSVEITDISLDPIDNGRSHRQDPPKFSKTDIDALVESFLLKPLKLGDDDCLSQMNADRIGILSYIEEHSSVAVYDYSLSPIELDSVFSPVGVDVSPKSTNAAPQRTVSLSTDDGEDMKQWMVYDPTTGRERRPLLFEFIRLLLDKDEYRHIAEYLDRNRGIFKLHAPKVVAKLWQRVKGRNSDASRSFVTVRNRFETLSSFAQI